MNNQSSYELSLEQERWPDQVAGSSRGEHKINRTVTSRHVVYKKTIIVNVRR